jgi:hypothetical protein
VAPPWEGGSGVWGGPYHRRLLLLALGAAVLLAVGEGLLSAQTLRAGEAAGHAADADDRTGSAAMGFGPGLGEAAQGERSGGRHFVVLRGGGDTSYLAGGTTATQLPAGTMVTFDPLRLVTSLGTSCPRWDLMARFGGRSVGDTRLVAGSWSGAEQASLGAAASYVLMRPEAMTWHAACYGEDGHPMALPPFSVHLEFVTATPFL